MNPKVKVLIIDDEELVRQYYRDCLESLGYTVAEAADGHAGLEVFALERPDVVFADLRMPKMDGLQVVAALREESPETPVIVVSGAGTVSDVAEAVRQGAWDYVVKPVHGAAELDHLIRRALERASLLAENRHCREQLEELVLARTRQLRESEERYRRLLESVTDYAYTVTIDNGQVVATEHRPGCAAVTGFTPEEYAADPDLWYRMVHEEDRPAVLEVARRILVESAFLAIEHRICHKDGSIRWVKNTLVPHRDEAGRLVAYDGTITDITEKKRAEEEIRTLNNGLEQRVAERTVELQQLNRQLEAFAYSVSHDLRAPLRHIQGFCTVLMEDCCEQLDETGRNCLERIASGCDHMDELINAILSFSRYTRQPLSKAAVATDQLVREVVADLGREQDNRQVEFVLGELLPCRADLLLLRQVFLNLLGNAVKYTRNRAVARIEAGSFRRDGETVYYVRDNGAGFDMRYANRLFGVFQRLHRADEFEGTGVGLAIVQSIITRHGGKVWAEAEVDQGATFYFTLR